MVNEPEASSVQVLSHDPVQLPVAVVNVLLAVLHSKPLVAVVIDPVENWLLKSDPMV